jgi:hypothetical protein
MVHPMHDTKREFAKRLKAAMEAAGYPARPAVLEREFNLRYWGKPMTLHGVRRWLEAETLPGLAKVNVLCEWLRCSPQDLGLGLRPSVPRAEQRRGPWDVELGYQERELFEAFMRLPVPQRRVVREVILTFVKAASSKP